MDHDGARWGARVGVLGRSVLEVESLRQLEVELDRCALEGALEGVADRDVDLGAVERAVAWVELPFAGVVLFEGLFELLIEVESIWDSVRQTRGLLTSSAAFHVSTSPRYFSGRVESSRWNSKPKIP